MRIIHSNQYYSISSLFSPGKDRLHFDKSPQKEIATRFVNAACSVVHTNCLHRHMQKSPFIDSNHIHLRNMNASKDLCKHINPFVKIYIAFATLSVFEDCEKQVEVLNIQWVDNRVTSLIVSVF